MCWPRLVLAHVVWVGLIVKGAEYQARLVACWEQSHTDLASGPVLINSLVRHSSRPSPQLTLSPMCLSVTGAAIITNLQKSKGRLKES